MTTYKVPFAGERDFQHSPDQMWDFDIDSLLGNITINVRLENGNLEDGLHKAVMDFPDLAHLDQLGRSEIHKEYSVEPSTSEYFVRYFEERYSEEEVAELFATDASVIGVDELLSALKLDAVSFVLGSEDYSVSLDYKLHAVDNDQILVVYLNTEGVCQGIAMES